MWGCPQCAAKIATRRADELSKVMRAVDDAGGSAFLLTLTMRHSRGDRLGLSKDERARLRRLEENRGSATSSHPTPSLRQEMSCLSWRLPACEGERTNWNCGVRRAPWKTGRARSSLDRGARSNLEQLKASS